ncbi:DUF3231 family protein [Virgibacillus sp. W0181]|uniref:DUF3231 family protein n=1 Tax=Virgibacillus sp. W0181 TaxID=3391581 RepID=UPI003F4468B7
MGMFSGNPKEEPMHYGEVFSIWTYFLGEKSMIAMYETLLNHAGDDDLKKLLQEAVHGAKMESQQVEELLKTNGIGLPPVPPERPMANNEKIPVGARVMDAEIGALLSANASKGLITCSTIMGQSIREDIATMFGQFHMNKAQFGAKVLRLNKDKGWLVHPPLHDTPQHK